MFPYDTKSKHNHNKFPIDLAWLRAYFCFIHGYTAMSLGMRPIRG